MDLLRAFPVVLAFTALGSFAQPCLVDYTLTASIPPTNGTYGCGETVTFCLTINTWNTTNANWLHGVVASFGPGWDMATLTPGAAPAPCGAGGGTWGWYNSVQGTAGTALGPQGPGFFYDLNNDGNAGNNFGDFCTGPWTFCWTISVLSGVDCINGLGLGVSVNTFGDSETGSWNSSGCTGDAVVVSQPAVILSCAADAGTGGPLALCTTQLPVNLIASLSGTPDLTGSWTDPSGAPFAGILDPATGASGNYTYTVGTVNPPCTASSVLAVSIAQQPDAGADGSVTLCTSDVPVDLVGALGGAPDPGGAWSGPAGASSGIFNPAIDAPGVYSYTIAPVAPCVLVMATVVVNVNASPNAGTNGVLTVCSNGPATALFNSLTGAPSLGGTWSGPGGPMSGTFDPLLDGAGAYNYTVAGAAPCPNSSATVQVTVNQLPDAGSNSSATLCSTAAPLPLTSLLGGTPDAGGSWTDPVGAGIGNTIDPATLPIGGSYTYTVSGVAPCPSAAAEVALTVNIQLSAGTSSTVNLCEASAAIDLLTALGGALDPFGSWDGPNGPVGSSVFTPATSTPGIYTYTVASLPPCANSSATVTVNVSSEPNAGVNAAQAFCDNDPPTALFPFLGAGAQPGGTWTDPSGAPWAGSFTPGLMSDGNYTYTLTGVPPCTSSSAMVTVSTTTAGNAGTGAAVASCETGPVFDLDGWIIGAPDLGGIWTTPSGAVFDGIVDPAIAPSGSYTYTIAANGPCPAVSAVMDVTIAPAPGAGTDGAVDLCSSTAAPYALFGALGGSPNAGGTWTDPNGAPHAPAYDVSTDPPGVYTYTVNAQAPCTSASSTVTVGLVQAANAGIGGLESLCLNDAAVDPMNWLGGSPDPGGEWTDANGTSITVIDPSVAASGVYTYTVDGTAPCPDVQATIDLTIDPLPDAGNDTSTDVCADAAAMDILPLLGAPAGGSWDGPSGSASSIFIPGVNVPGDYTYTLNGIGACNGEVDQATVTIAVNPLPQPAFSADTTRGCAPLSVTFSNGDPASAQSALWSFGDGGTSNAITDILHQFLDPGSFDVTLQVTDANGCTGSITAANMIAVSGGPPAEFYALPLRVSVEEPTTQITHVPLSLVEYTWTIDGLSLDSSGVFHWTFDPPTLGDHEICLVATDTLGCSNTDCLRVLVDDDLTIYVANAFTPNGDGNNDSFRPSILGVQEDWYDFMVFDRWGLLVFRTTDPQEAWNGGLDNAGDPLPNDVYVWTLKAKDQFTPEKAELIGTVTLLK